MKIFDFKWVLIVLLSVFVLSCKKDSETAGSSSGGSNSSGGGSGGGDNGGGGGSGSASSTSTSTARYTQNATLEDYTAIWCGGCPAAKTVVDQAVTQYGSKIIPMEFHPGGTSAHFATNNDTPLSFVGESVLESTFAGAGYPSQFINRKQLGGIGILSVSQIAPYVTASGSSAISSTVGLAINSSLSGANLSITVKSRFAQATNGAKLVVYVLEDGIVTGHDNYYNNMAGSPWQGKGDNILNYVNDGVVRTSVTAVLGDAIPNQAAASEYSKTYSATIPAGWNSSKLRIAAMVVTSANKLLNAQQAKVGQAKNFEILAP